MHQIIYHDKENFDLDNDLDLNQFEYARKDSLHRNQLNNHRSFPDDSDFDAGYDEESFIDEITSRRSYTRRKQLPGFGDNIAFRPDPEYEAEYSQGHYARQGLQTTALNYDDGYHGRGQTNGSEYHDRHYARSSYSARRADPVPHHTRARSVIRRSESRMSRPVERRRSPDLQTHYNPRRNSQIRDSRNPSNNEKYEQTKNWVQRDFRDRVTKTSARREQIRKFPSPNIKAPHIPIPDYDGHEKGVQYVPLPDY